MNAPPRQPTDTWRPNPSRARLATPTPMPTRMQKLMRVWMRVWMPLTLMWPAAAMTNDAPADTPTFPARAPATWLTYHLAHPGTTAPGDPNAGLYWKGRYHLHYIYEGPSGASWAHVSSRDMVHWRWHPTTLTPATMGHGLFSGTAFVTKEGRPAIIYHGAGSGRNQVAVAEDDLLERWSKPIPVEPRTASGAVPEMRHWDPDCWVDGDAYFAISGGKDPHWMTSRDLRHWEYLGRLLPERTPALGVPRDEDISCPNMFRIGDHWMLLCLSHWMGARYYLGQFQDGKFLPEAHARLNWMCAFDVGHEDADLFAPESLLTPDGRRVMWAWARVRQRLAGVPIQSSIQCLPREIRLGPDGLVRLRPLRELEGLRHGGRSVGPVLVQANTSHRLRSLSGDALELKVVFHGWPGLHAGVQVHGNASGTDGFPIVFDAPGRALWMGGTPIPLELGSGEDLELRIFVDGSIIEVFANDRVAALSPHRHEPGDVGVSLLSRGGPAVAREVGGWKMRPIYGPARRGSVATGATRPMGTGHR